MHSVGHVTTVALFYANDIGLQILRRKEGVPLHYVEKEITVIDACGDEIQAITYVVAPNKREKFVRPSVEYLKVCREGFQKIGINTNGLDAAAEDKPIERLPAVFTYGTLMRGEPRFEVIAKFGLTCALTAFCFGSLSTNGMYPSLNLEGQGFSRGDYFVSNDIANLLAVTDQIEGFEGFGSKENLFRRTCVPVDVGGSGQRLAWVYVRDDEFDNRLLNNDWRAFRGTRRPFSEALLDAHERNTSNFYEKLTSNYARFANIETLKRQEVIILLNDETSLTEKSMAQISNNWVALTSEHNGVKNA